MRRYFRHLAGTVGVLSRSMAPVQSHVRAYVGGAESGVQNPAQAGHTAKYPGPEFGLPSVYCALDPAVARWIVNNPAAVSELTEFQDGPLH